MVIATGQRNGSQVVQTGNQHASQDKQDEGLRQDNILLVTVVVVAAKVVCAIDVDLRTGGEGGGRRTGGTNEP